MFGVMTKLMFFSISFITNNQTVSKVVFQKRSCVVSTEFLGYRFLHGPKAPKVIGKFENYM